MSTLLAQRSLVDHVRDVATGLRAGLPEGRRAVSMIVGRDPERLDASGVGRAAVESLAENLSDGVVAPLFWAAVAGLPGILAYKAINTLDSMVGHRSERYRDFGWASARLRRSGQSCPRPPHRRPPVPRRRLAPALCRGSCGATPPGTARPMPAGPRPPWRRALGVRLAGPRVYAGVIVDDAWMGDGRAEVGPAEIERAIGACLARLVAARRGGGPGAGLQLLAGQRQQPVEVEAALEMLRQPVQRRLDPGLVGQRWRRPAADAAEEGGAEGVGGEQAVQVAAHHPAVGAHGAVGRAVAGAASAAAGPGPSVRPIWIS